MKNKTIKVSFLFLTIITFGSQLFGQSEKAFHFGLSITPKYSFQSYENNKIVESKSVFGFESSIDAYFDLNSRLQLRTGLKFSYNQVNQLDYSLVFACDIANPLTENYLLNSWTEDLIKANYLGIPINFKLKLIGESNHIYTMLGITQSIKLSTKSSHYLVECSTSRSEIDGSFRYQLKNYIFVLNGGFGVETALSKKLKLFIEPEISYSPIGIFKEDKISPDIVNNMRIFDLGLRLGIIF